MKRFIIKTVCLFIVLAAIDFGIGHTCRILKDHAIGGDTGRLNNIVDSLTDEILVFGSSRAIHHYDPLILQDSLRMGCYNCGRNGNGIIYNYGQYRLLASHYTPKIIIYDICVSFDLTKGEENTKYLSWLKRYYDRPGIDSIFWSVEPTSRYKMLSQMYRYNSDFIQMASDCLNPLQSDIKGYRPLDAVMEYEPIIKESSMAYEYDELKFYYWRKLIADCKTARTKLIFMVSPLYKANDESVYRPIIELARQEGIPFISHYTDSTFCLNKDYFKDPSHMNKMGATAYTKFIVSELLLKSYLHFSN